MKINSDIFQTITPAEEQERLVEELCTEETYYFIARVYSDLCLEYGAGIYRILPWKNVNSDVYRKRIEQIKKLISITVALGVPFAVYMRAQFEQQLPFLKSRFGLNHVPLRNMISERGKESYKHYRWKLNSKYVLSDDKAQYYNEVQLNIKRSLEESMQVMAERLEANIKQSLAGSIQALADSLDSGHSLTEQEVIEELDSLARRGRVSNLYVFNHPLGRRTQFLKEVSDAVAKKLLDKKSLEKVKKVYAELLEGFSEGVKEYL